MYETGEGPAEIIEKRGMKQVTDIGEIEGAVDDAIASGAPQVEQYRRGNEKVFGWFVGQVMKGTQGKANPKTVTELLRKKLEN